MVTSRVAGRIRVQLEVARTDGAPRRIAVAAPPDATCGAVLDVVAAHLGLATAAGAVQARSLVCGAWLDRFARLGDVGLLRGERLSVAIGLAPAEAPRRLQRWPDSRSGDAEGRVPVNRPPRSVRPEPGLSVTLPVARKARRPRRFPLGAMVLPLVLGGLFVLVTKRPEVALFSLFTPVMVAWNHLDERRAHKEEIEEYGATHDEEVHATTDRLRSFTDEWSTWLLRHHPAPDEATAIARTLSPRLWERQPGDPDFLRLRVGLATRRAPAVLGAGPSAAGVAEDELRGYEEATVVVDAPVLVDLGAEGLLAVLGRDADVTASVSWLVVQLATLHSPADVALVLALADDDLADACRWLPHLSGDRLDTEPVATTRAEANALLSSVADLGRRRRSDREARRPTGPTLVVVVDDRLEPAPARVAAVTEYADVGIVVVWLGREARAVPTTAAYLLRLDPGRTGELVAHHGGERIALAPDRLGRSAALDVSACLAPVRDASDARVSRSLPEQVSLEELLPGLGSAASIRRRWEAASSETLVARLGVSADGPVELDLGPSGSHVLLGGTTGSGKSELLQSMVAALAAEHPPSAVGFLFVDYKGGAAFKDAMHLPHCVGVVSDLDSHLTRRVMQALDAEIKRREHLLADRGARDLAELRRLAPDTAPGELVIVVDEFATLAKEIPEFVEGVVDVAARGRSLGLRLVLATQRPAGVVSERIRANVAARIALRVNDESDSVDVIGERYAAHISRSLPGRGFLRVHRDLVEFQAAHVGGPADLRVQGTIEVHDLAMGPGRRSAAGSRGGATAPTAPTVLEGLVRSCQQVMRLGRWPRPHAPWLPALPPVVTVAELRARVPVPGVAPVLLGLADLPERQEQRVVPLDLGHHQNLLVFGTSRSGKTTVLRTVAAALIEGCSPQQVQIFGMDFAGHGLRQLEDAPQCAGVVGPDDPGRIGRLVRRLAGEVQVRKQLLATSGVARYEQLATTSFAPLPRLVVLLDGYAGAAAALERLEGGRLLDQVGRLVADGPAVGLHFVITADRRAVVPSALTSVITTRMVLRMAERDDYALLGVDTALARDAILGPGRGFIQGTTEVQVAVAASPLPEEEHRALDSLIATASRSWPIGAPSLRRMPAQVSLADLPVPPAPLVLPIGVGDLEVSPVALDLTEGHALVAGPPRSGKSTTLVLLAAAASRAPDAVAVAVFAGRRSPALDAAPADVGPVDATDPETLARGVDEVTRLLDAGRAVLCLCDDVDSMPDPSSAVLEDLARRGRERPVRFVAATDNRVGLRAYVGLTPEVRRAKQGVLLAPDLDLDGDLLGVRLRTPLESAAGVGRGFLVDRGTAELVQLAHLGDSTSNTTGQPAARRNHEMYRGEGRATSS